MINEWELASTNQGRLRKRKYEVAVLPIGATEAHNMHLPEGQDFLTVDHIARRCCKQAWEKEPRVICLPAIPYGSDCNLMDFPLTIDVKQATLDAMVRDVIASLVHHGIRKIVLINGHGGNDFVPLVRVAQTELKCHIFLCDWWTVALDRYGEIFQKPDNHAGEMETSVGMAVHGDLVEPATAKSGKVRPYRFEALEKGWVKTSRIFSKLNDHCAVGDPAGASPEKGQKYLDIICQRISDFLVDLAKSPIDRNFPQVS